MLGREGGWGRGARVGDAILNTMVAEVSLIGGEKIPSSVSQLGPGMGLGGDWPWLSQDVSARRQTAAGRNLKFWLKLELWSWKLQSHLHH